MTQARELEQQRRFQQERRVRVDQIRLKGKGDELSRRLEQLSLCEAFIKHQEEDLQVCEAALKGKSDSKRMQRNHPLEKCNRLNKLYSLRHVRSSGGVLTVRSTKFYT